MQNRSFPTAAVQSYLKNPSHGDRHVLSLKQTSIQFKHAGHLTVLSRLLHQDNKQSALVCQLNGSWLRHCIG